MSIGARSAANSFRYTAGAYGASAARGEPAALAQQFLAPFVQGGFDACLKAEFTKELATSDRGVVLDARR
jgi:hypothetical protein